MSREDFPQACTALMASITRIRLYGAEHRMTLEATEDLISILETILSDEGRLRIAISGEELIFNDRPFPQQLGPVQSLGHRLSAKGIGLLEFLSGLQPQEVLRFCHDLAGPKGTAIRSQPHILIGEAQLTVLDGFLGGDQLELLRVRDLAGDRQSPITDEATKVMQLSQRFEDSGEVRSDEVDEIVYSFISRLGKHKNLFHHLAEIREHNLFTYLHTCNVATLTIGFAMALGLEEKLVYDLGTAALLHDVGKRIVPEEVLQKPGVLLKEEWELIKRHPVEGARMLLKLKGIPHLAVVVAFEHHLHFDGYGGYPEFRPPRRPSAYSQLMSIADSFDALFANRSYHRRYDILECLEILHTDAGTIYNPQLVDLFTRYVNLNLED